MFLLLLAFAHLAVEDAMPAPVAAAPGEILVAPGAAVRAATLAQLTRSPPQPVEVRFMCEISDRGEPRRCLSANAPLPATWPEFYDRSAEFGRSMLEAGADEIMRAALDRVRVVRLRVDPAAASRRRLVILTETISATDAWPVAPPAVAAGRIPAAELQFSYPDAAPELLDTIYPEYALRNEWWARVVMTCRVADGAALQCRDAVIELPDRSDARQQERAEVSRQMIMASYQLSSVARVEPKAPGRDLAGQDVEFSLTWRIED